MEQRSLFNLKTKNKSFISEAGHQLRGGGGGIGYKLYVILPSQNSSHTPKYKLKTKQKKSIKYKLNLNH